MSAGAATKKIVLVVDDDEAIRMLVARALGSKYHVIDVGDAIAATEVLSRRDLTVDLLICDVMMPNFDGFSLVKSLRSTERMRRLHVIFLTAKTAPSAVITGIQLGARHYVQKPF